ncbi:hypothetical protein C4559_05305 [Candidatus Microgenomates bacterium]|nr:MAG: hypothetical protein C4559_05305 [Candidatus Microgenomates bacterium]
MFLSEKERNGFEKFFGSFIGSNKDGQKQIAGGGCLVGFMPSSRLEPEKTAILLRRGAGKPIFIRSPQISFIPNHENPESIIITGEPDEERIIYKEEGEIFVR